MFRLTKNNRQKLLDENNGFERQTSYDSRNSTYSRQYRIENGKLRIRETGKTSWSDSRYDKNWIANDEETHRFLYKFIDELFHDDN